MYMGPFEGQRSASVIKLYVAVWQITSLEGRHLSCGAGRVEFTEYFPENTQGVLVQPIGDEGVLVVATDTQRGFGRLDQV